MLLSSLGSERSCEFIKYNCELVTFSYICLVYFADHILFIYYIWTRNISLKNLCFTAHKKQNIYLHLNALCLWSYLWCKPQDLALKTTNQHHQGECSPACLQFRGIPVHVQDCTRWRCFMMDSFPLKLYQIWLQRRGWRQLQGKVGTSGKGWADERWTWQQGGWRGKEELEHKREFGGGKAGGNDESTL